MAANGNLLSDGLFIAGGSAAAFDTSESTTDVFAAGQLGRIAHIKNTTTGAVGDDTKVVQYVSRYATDTVTVGVGSPAFWQDIDNFVVTAEVANAVGATSTLAVVAGVFGSSNPAAGSYGFIQVGGPAAFRMLDSTSASTTGAAGAPAVFSTNLYWKKATVISTNTETALAAVQGETRTLSGRIIAGNNATGTGLTVTGILDVIHNGW